MIYHLYHLFKNDVRTLAFCDLYYSVEEKTTILPKWRTEVPDVPSRPPRAPSHDYFRTPAKLNVLWRIALCSFWYVMLERKKDRLFSQLLSRSRMTSL
jgi:hypothetical protein